MKKKISKITLIVLFFHLLSPFYSVSLADNNKKCEDNPPVCSATPESMSKYINFQNEVLTLLQNKPFLTVKDTIGAGEGGIFTNKLLDLPKIKAFDDSLLGQSLKIFYTSNARSVVSIITSAFLFELSALSAILDAAGFTILFQERPIVRDRQKLLDIDWKINRTAYYLGQMGEIGKKISDTSELNKIIDKYKEEGLIKTNVKLDNEIRYMDLLLSLENINISVKQFLAYGTINGIEENNQVEIIKFNEDWMGDEGIKGDYKCARLIFGKCSSSIASFKRSMKTLGKSIKNQGKGSREKINTSIKELGAALSSFPKGAWNNLKGKSSNDELTEKEKKLLRDVYGLDTTRMTKDESYSIISVNKQLKDSFKKIGDQLSNLFKDTKKKRDTDEYKQDIVEITKKLETQWNSFKKLRDQIEQKEGDEKRGKEAKSLVKDYDNIKETIDSIKKKKEESKVAKKIKNLKEDMEMFAIKANIQEKRYQATQNQTISDEDFKKLFANKKEVTSISIAGDNKIITQDFNILYTYTHDIIDIIGTKDKRLRKILNSVCEKQCKNKPAICFTN